MRELEPVVERARGDAAVLAVIHFGSSARGEPYRDIDVALVMSDPGGADPWETWRQYARDSPENVDVQIFHKLPIYVQARVLREGKVLWCRDEDALYEAARRTTREFEDFRPRYRAYLDGAGLA